MPRIRSIKPGFFRSEDVSALPLRARLTWIGLWTYCDDAGRTKDNAKLIKGDIWPLDAVSLRDIEEDLQTLANHGRIVRYEVDGKFYLEIVNWAQHQAISKPSPSRIPAPSAGRVLTTEEPAEELTEDSGDESFREDSRNAPGVLPEDPRKAPAWKGGEGKGGEGKGGERARPMIDGRERRAVDPTSPPPSRCPKHTDVQNPPACGGCRDARREREAWDADHTAAAAEARSTAARQRAEANAAAVAACGHCDHRGRLPGGVLCAHDPASADRTQRGLAAARAALAPQEAS